MSKIVLKPNSRLGRKLLERTGSTSTKKARVEVKKGDKVRILTGDNEGEEGRVFFVDFVGDNERVGVEIRNPFPDRVFVNVEAIEVLK